METTLQNGEIAYIETPRRCDTPVKIDEILNERLKAFMKARRARGITLME